MKKKNYINGVIGLVLALVIINAINVVTVLRNPRTTNKPEVSKNTNMRIFSLPTFNSTLQEGI